MSSDGRTGCPGAGEKPAGWPNVRGRDLPEGEGVCPRCGGGYKLRADGRIRAHRVPKSSIVPMIRRGLDPAGRLRGRRA